MKLRSCCNGYMDYSLLRLAFSHYPEVTTVEERFIHKGRKSTKTVEPPRTVRVTRRGPLVVREELEE